MRFLCIPAVLSIVFAIGCGSTGELSGTQEKALKQKLAGPPNALHRHGGADRANKAPAPPAGAG